MLSTGDTGHRNDFNFASLMAGNGMNAFVKLFVLRQEITTSSAFRNTKPSVPPLPERGGRLGHGLVITAIKLNHRNT